MTQPCIRLGVDACSGACGNVPNVPITASPNVYTNSIPQVRNTDVYAAHPLFVPHGGRAVSGGSLTVFVNGLRICRNTDAISCGSTAANGSPDVFAG